MLAVARLDDHAVGADAHDGCEPPVLDLEHHDAEIGTDDREVRVPIADADVVVDEIVLGEMLAERGKDLALPGGRGVALVGEALGDSERHTSIVSRAPEGERELLCGNEPLGIVQRP